MSATDTVPCFYTGQQDFEQPSKNLPRSKCRELKAQLLGKFENHGRTFRFFQTMEGRKKPLFNGPLGVGNLLPFAKAHNYGDKLHYEMPMAGHKTALARSRRKLLHPSSRSLFSQPGIQWASYLRRVSA